MESIAVVAMDIHKRFSRAVSMDAWGKVVGSQDVAHGDKAWMRGYLSQFREGTTVVMEGTFGWPWVSDLAEEAGLKPELAHALRARAMAKGMPKSDQRDALWLGKLWLAGGQVFPRAYRSSPEVRGLRALFRSRNLMVSMQTQLKNSLHGILLREGHVLPEISDAFSSRGLESLRGIELSPAGRQEMEAKLELLEDLRKHIRKIEVRIKDRVKKDPQADLLMTIPGIGPLTAFGLMAEMGEIGRFANGRALAAYAGVLPLSHESAGKDQGRKTGSQCNKHLRWLLIEAATGAVRGSFRFKSLHSRVKAKNKRCPGKARIAVARALAETVHLVLTRKVPYVDIPAERPGTSIHPNRASQKCDPAGSKLSQAEY